MDEYPGIPKINIQEFLKQVSNQTDNQVKIEPQMKNSQT